MTQIPSWVVIVLFLSVAGLVIYFALKFIMAIFLSATEKIKEKIDNNDKSDET